MAKNRYEDMVRVIAKSDRTITERGEQIIKDVGKVIETIMNYNYTVAHYEGNAEGVVQDKVGSIKNSLAILESDVDVYKESLGITRKVWEKKQKRVNKIMDRIRGK